jgi:hydrogenase expression/formation protein HypE
MDIRTPGSLAGGPSCPAPALEDDAIQMAHGAGGRMMQRLLDSVFLRAFDNPALALQHDGAFLEVGAGRLAISTDSFVISPLFFPGGDIGSLAVHGTVNDLAMCGARPLALTAGFILEEGLPMETLRRIVGSMTTAAAQAGVPIVTGDTKVVDRGKGDGVFINTTGVGVVPLGVCISPDAAKPGDRILVSGTIADHGVAIMSVRRGIEFGTTVESDSASLVDLVAGLLDAVGADVRVLRDPTRGGVASVLCEIAGASKAGLRIEESRIPVREEVRAACEILGLDPLYVANEGKCLVIVAPESAEAALAALRRHPLGAAAAIIGEVVADHPGRVVQKSRIGGSRIVERLSGEPLPRIC